MPPKKKAVAGPPAARPWTTEELALVRKQFANHTTRELAEKLGRTPKSVSHCAANLGLAKNPEHRSAQSRLTALAIGRTPEEMRTLGSLGGQIGGPARAAKLKPKERARIAKLANQARNAPKT